MTNDKELNYIHYARLTSREKNMNNTQKNILIHIGKCGGSTCRLAIEQSAVSMDEIVHVYQPPIDENAAYYVIARTPISRALSAFNWRYHLVVATRGQRRRFPGEHEILRYYKTLNNLAEALYLPDGTDNALAQGHFRSIHHLGESISFYLEPLVSKISSDQIRGVVMQENLPADIQAVFGVPLQGNDKVHKAKTPKNMLLLSEQAKENLRKLLSEDFRCLRVLQSWGKLSEDSIAALDREETPDQAPAA